MILSLLLSTIAQVAEMPIEQEILNYEQEIMVPVACGGDYQPSDRYVSTWCTDECSDEGVHLCREKFLSKFGFTNSCDGGTGCSPIGTRCGVTKIKDGGGNGTISWDPPLDQTGKKHKLCMTCPSSGNCTWAPAYSCDCVSTL